jgi:tetratricopeptide (TPR) repeat protein
MDNNSSVVPTMLLTAVKRPLPSWVTPTTFAVAGLALVAVVAIASPNFGVAAIAAGIVSLIVAVVAVIFLVVDQPARSQWMVTAIVLAALGIIALLGNGAAYQVAISQAEAHQNYGAAVSELKATGKVPPYSTDLANAYLDWANTEIAAHAYSQAVAHFTYVAQQFPTLPQAATAQAALPGAYLAWAQYASAHNDPITAGENYQILLTQYASSPEASTALSAAPAAYLAWGDAEAQAKYYDQAYTAYSLIAKNFPKSAQATAAHQKAAQVLSDWATALTQAHRYAEAAVHYNDLAKNYADTTPGKAAIKLLQQGVPVIGRLFKADGKTPVLAYTTVRLSSSWNVAGGSYTVSGTQYYIDTDANGYFDFPSIPSGQYLLEWRTTTGPFQTFFNGTTPLEVITVHPLETVELPPITTTQK